MKKLILAGACAALLSACAGMSGLLGGGNPQIKELSAKTTEISVNFAYALNESAVSYTAALEAVGNKTEAERIKGSVGNLRDETDKDKLEASIGMLNEVDLTVQLESAENLSDEGKAQITAAILHMGIAIYLDGKIVADAVDVVKTAKDVLTNLSPSDALAAGEVNTIITNASWISDVAPDQITILTKSFEGLKNYAQTHGIEIPSQEEIEQQAASIGRE